MSLIEAAAFPTHFGTVDLGVLPSELDGGVASRAAIGLVVLATDQTMEHEFRILVRQPGVAFYEFRVFNDHDITPETLRAIGARIAPSVDLILPSIELDVVAFGCTSATMTSVKRRSSLKSIRSGRMSPARPRSPQRLRRLERWGQGGSACSPPMRPRSTRASSDISAIAVSISPRSPPSTGATTAKRPVLRSPRSKTLRAASPGRKLSTRFSSPAPACVSPRPSSGWSSASARPSPPATTRWRGIACGLPESTMSSLEQESSTPSRRAVNFCGARNPAAPTTERGVRFTAQSGSSSPFADHLPLTQRCPTRRWRRSKVEPPAEPGL